MVSRKHYYHSIQRQSRCKDHNYVLDTVNAAGMDEIHDYDDECFDIHDYDDDTDDDTDGDTEADDAENLWYGGAANSFSNIFGFYHFPVQIFLWSFWGGHFAI